MSRCFPFPPPGYERKHRSEDLDVLKQAKLKEKKHKKEKKDKERKKDKEKKEKDGSGEKHRDKKDRKGKHKDKKEKHRDKKERSKDKEKSSISEESTVAGKLEEESEDKLHSKGSSVVDERKCLTLLQGQNGEKPFQSILPSQSTAEAKFVQELDRRIRDDETSRGSQILERVASVDKRDQQAAGRTAVRNPSGLLADEKGKNGIKRVEIRKKDTLGLGNEFTGKAMVQNLTRVTECKVEGISRPVEEQNNWRLEDKEQYKETGDDKRGDRHKDRDKKDHGKDDDKEKEKKKEEKPKVKTKNRKSEHERSKNIERSNPVFATSNKGTNLLKDVDSTLSEGNLRKRKDTDTNGFLHESEIRPNKIQRPAPTPYQSTENGRKLEASQIPSKSSSDKHAVPHNVPLDHRDRLVNGIIKAQKPSPSKPNPSFETTIIDQTFLPKIAHRDSKNAVEAKIEDHIAEASRRPPHPDSKYLSQVLAVPTVGSWPENDVQEWLFGKKDPPNKPKSELTGVKEEPQVWSEAVHIESADVFALPYVLPY